MDFTKYVNVPPNAHEGQCRACMRRRPVVAATRSGGGNYRRSNRSVPASICGECAVNFLRNITSLHHTAMGFDLISLDHLVSRIDTDDARAVHAHYRTVADEHFARSRQNRARQERETMSTEDY